jgi:hypothetical protein
MVICESGQLEGHIEVEDGSLISREGLLDLLGFHGTFSVGNEPKFSFRVVRSELFDSKAQKLITKSSNAHLL